MANFQFKYQNIEDIKEKVKKNAEKEYALILVKIEEKKQEIEEVEGLIEESYTVKTKSTAKELIFLNNYRDSLTQRLKKKNVELKELDKKKARKLKELTVKYQEHKIFEKLKEKMKADFHHEMLKNELKNNDDIANQKFNRKEK